MHFALLLFGMGWKNYHFFKFRFPAVRLSFYVFVRNIKAPVLQDRTGAVAAGGGIRLPLMHTRRGIFRAVTKEKAAGGRQRKTKPKR